MPIVSLRRIVAASLLLAAACADETPSAGQRAPDAPAPINATAGTPRVPQTATVSRAEFARLDWLDGTFRGRNADGSGAPFFESYHRINDSTIEIRYYADSTLRAVTGTGSVEWRGGQVHHRVGAAAWVATVADSARLEFAPVAGAQNRFTWQRANDSTWSAVLFAPDTTQPPTRYEMQPISAAAASRAR